MVDEKSGYGGDSITQCRQTKTEHRHTKKQNCHMILYVVGWTFSLIGTVRIMNISEYGVVGFNDVCTFAKPAPAIYVHIGRI